MKRTGLIVFLLRGYSMKNGTQLVFLGALTRLFELEMKRYQIESEHNKGEFKPLEGVEHAEYDGLKKWFYEIGDDNRMRLREFAGICGKQISAVADKPSQAPSLIITPPGYNQ